MIKICLSNQLYHSLPFQHLKLLHGRYERFLNPKLVRTVPTLRDNVVLNVRILCTTQRFVQRPARGHGAHHVIPALHNGDG